MRLLLSFLLLALLALQYKLWLGEGSVREWRHYEKKLALAKLQNQKLQKRNESIEAEVLELKSGDQALEEQARYEMGMIKEDEAYFHFIDAAAAGNNRP